MQTYCMYAEANDVIQGNGRRISEQEIESQQETCRPNSKQQSSDDAVPTLHSCEESCEYYFDPVKSNFVQES